MEVAIHPVARTGILLFYFRMTNPTLLVLAAGMGSRYGGLKQLDPMGPAGEPLLDYSVFDAIRAGFGRVVFVIRRDFEAQFRQEVGARFERQIEVDYVFQDLHSLPGGFQAPASRQKPWGTGHAIWCAREKVQTPFAAINADDFYGRDAYRVLAGFFQDGPEPAAGRAQFAMVAYRLDRTLSSHGSVSRGVCVVDADGHLQTVEERTSIEHTGVHGARYVLPDGSFAALTGDETVSLNFWGFTPEVFPLLESGFSSFLGKNLDQPKAEYYIPSAVAEMIDAGAAQVSVLPTEAVWFGVTYREDKPVVAVSLAELARRGEYPSQLWE